MATHGMAAIGPTVLAADTRQIIPGGLLTLPAGGPWIIHTLWTNIIHNVPAAGEGISGDVTLDSVAGDLTPDPAPALYPLIGPNPIIGATCAPAQVPVQMFNVNWSAAGKAVLQLDHTLHTAITAAGYVSAGIIFSDRLPVPKPRTFVDRVEQPNGVALEQQLGTITISERATRITGIMGILSKNTVLTAGEGIMATMRIDSNDVKLPPGVYPFSNAISGALGVALGQPTQPVPQWIDLDIPVEGGSRINIFGTLQGAVTLNVQMNVYLSYE